MRILIMTDMEGVAGIQDLETWCEPAGRYYELGKRFLTQELNAAIRGFFDAGAEHIMVIDGHGAGGIDVELLDERVELARRFSPPWPWGLDRGFDFAACVGQHAKACTPCAHLAHTQYMGYIDLSVNGVSIGEFGQFAMCATECGVRFIFGSGDEAFTKEAQALVPGVETVSVKRGTNPAMSENLCLRDYARANTGAIHLHPREAARRIEQGARKALEHAKSDDSFGFVTVLAPPYSSVTVLRPDVPWGVRRMAVQTHPDSFIALMNSHAERKPITEFEDERP